MQGTEDSATGLRARHTVVIFLVSLAGLLLEVGHTRSVSFNPSYYYVYPGRGRAPRGDGPGGSCGVRVPDRVPPEPGLREGRLQQVLGGRPVTGQQVGGAQQCGRARVDEGLEGLAFGTLHCCSPPDPMLCRYL